MERVPHSRAGEHHAIDADRVVTDLQIVSIAGVDPRASVREVPGPRPIRQFFRSIFQRLLRARNFVGSLKSD